MRRHADVRAGKVLLTITARQYPKCNPKLYLSNKGWQWQTGISKIFQGNPRQNTVRQPIKHRRQRKKGLAVMNEQTMLRKDNVTHNTT